MKASLTLVGVLALLGCGRQAETPYAPWEEGLTLIYEDPSLSEPERSAKRLQKRVERCQTEGSLKRVDVSYSTLSAPPMQATFLLEHQGVRMLVGSQVQMILPESFASRTTPWELGGTSCHVIGGAVRDLPKVELPSDADRRGVWVESTGPGFRQRIFFLPDVGEAEQWVWRDGRWICVNRLVSRGFADSGSRPR